MLRSYQEWLSSRYTPIAGGALESNINGAWFAKQSAKGTPVASASWTKRGRWVGGDLQSTRTDGSEAWSDQTLFADTVDFANTLVGGGAPVLQGQSSLVAYHVWLANGQETVTGGTNAVITLTPTAVTAGTFTLSWTILGNTYTTGNIAFNATAAVILTAIQAVMPSGWSGVNVVAAGGPMNSTPVTLTFSGATVSKRPVALPTVGSGSLTGTITPTTTTAGTGYSHVSTPADTGGFYYGIAKSVGKTTVHRVQFNDCKTQSLRIEGSSASKVVKVTPTIISLDPGQIMAADPTALDDGLRPFIYTEAAGTFTIDGTIYRGQSSFAAMFTWGLDSYYGDAVTVFDLINNTATASLEGVTILIDQAGLARFNSQIYGTPTPATGAKPLQGIPANGSYSCQFNRVDPNTGLVSESLLIEFPGVKWEPSLAIPANPGGGAVELSFAGAMRKVSGVNYPFRITTVNPIDVAFTI